MDTTPGFLVGNQLNQLDFFFLIVDLKGKIHPCVSLIFSVAFSVPLLTLSQILGKSKCYSSCKVDIEQTNRPTDILIKHTLNSFLFLCHTCDESEFSMIKKKEVCEIYILTPLYIRPNLTCSKKTVDTEENKLQQKINIWIVSIPLSISYG